MWRRRRHCSYSSNVCSCDPNQAPAITEQAIQSTKHQNSNDKITKAHTRMKDHGLKTRWRNLWIRTSGETKYTHDHLDATFQLSSNGLPSPTPPISKREGGDQTKHANQKMLPTPAPKVFATITIRTSEAKRPP